jgi:AraC-like DNA-binding protein
VSFQYARPAYGHAYAHVFGGTERFGQATTGVELASFILDRPHLHRDTELHSLVLERAERNLSKVYKALSVTDKVRAVLLGGSGFRLPEMAHVAREMSISVRSLRRHLIDEGTSFRLLVQEIQLKWAYTLLRNPAYNLQGISHALGFSDVTAFHRAFRRWTNTTVANSTNQLQVRSRRDHSRCA